MLIGVYFNRTIFNQIRRGKILRELEYLVQEGIPEGVEFFVFCPRGIEWWNKKIDGLSYDLEDGSWKEKKFDFPDGIYDRATFPEEEKEIGHEVRKILRKDHNIIFLNTKHYFDKWETHQALSSFSELRKYLPETKLYNHQLILERLLNKYETVYIKDSAGKLGHNIFKVQRNDSGKYTISHQKNDIVYHKVINSKELYNTLKTGDLSGKNIIAQQGVSLAKLKGKPFDIRILVQKNPFGKWELVDKSIRVAAADNSVVTNISSGGEVKSFKEVVPMIFPKLSKDIEKDISNMSLDISRRLEERYGRLGELGIDAALDSNGRLWLIEVNGKPAKSCVHNSNNPQLIHKAYHNLVKYFKYLITARDDDRSPS